jgi:phosphate acetyltransferase
MNSVANVPFDQIEVGQSLSVSRTVSRPDLEALAFDNAIDEQAAKTKKIDSPVAGKVDILLVPDLEAGNMVAKQLQYLAGADAAALVLGTRVPIVLTSRADSVRTRLASIAVMAMVAEAKRRAALTGQSL